MDDRTAGVIAVIIGLIVMVGGFFIMEKVSKHYQKKNLIEACQESPDLTQKEKDSFIWAIKKYYK